MSSDQLKAITDMKLSFQDVASTMTDLGITFTPPTVNGTQMAPGQGFGGDFSGMPMDDGGGPVIISGGQGEPPSGSSGTTGGRPSTGDVGGFQGADQGMIVSQDLSQSQIATMQASRGSSTGRGRVPTVLIDALIDLLQERSQP